MDGVSDEHFNNIIHCRLSNINKNWFRLSSICPSEGTEKNRSMDFEKDVLLEYVQREPSSKFGAIIRPSIFG